MEYTILNDWINGKLKSRWELYKQNIINSHPELSPIASGCYAARILEKEFNVEFDKIFQYRSRPGDTTEFLNFVDEVNFYYEDNNFRLDLVDWSGTRWAEFDYEFEPYINAAHGMEPNRIEEQENTRRELTNKAEQVKISIEQERIKRDNRNKEIEKIRKSQEERISYWKINHPYIIGKGSKISFDYRKKLVEEDYINGVFVPNIVLTDYGIL